MKKYNLITFLIVTFLIIGVFPFYPAPGNAGSIVDNFDAVALNDRLWETYSDDQHQRCVQQDGVLKIQIDGASAGQGWFGAGIRSKFILKGNFEIVVDYNLTNWPTHNGVRGNIMFWEAKINGINGHIDRCSFGADEPPNPKENYVSCFEDDAFLDVVIKPTTDFEGKLKLTRVGKIITGYFWQNNAWQKVGSHDYTATGLEDWLGIDLNAHSSLASLNPGGQLVHPFAGLNVEIVFDNLQITYDQIKYYSNKGPSPGLLLLLD